MVAAVALAALAGGLFGPRLLATEDEVEARYRVFTAALPAVEAQYVGPVESDRLVYSSINGLLNTLDSIGFACDEGVRRIEFLGGPERYKSDLADGFEPMYEAVGHAASIRGSVAVAARVGAIRTRRFLKRSPAIRKTSAPPRPSTGGASAATAR